MRIASSLSAFFISAFLFSFSANADYAAELNLYERCKAQYKNGSCDAVAFFSKKSVLEKFTSCQLPPDIASTLESSSAGANCTNVKSISKLCADSFQKLVVQQSASYCARVSQQQAAAASAGKSGSAPKAAARGSNAADATAILKDVGVPLVAAFDKKEKDKKVPTSQPAASVINSARKDSPGAAANTSKQNANVANTATTKNESVTPERLVQLGGPVDPNARQGVEQKADNNELIQLGGPSDNPRAAEAAASTASADMMASVTTAKQSMPDAAKVIDNFASATKNAPFNADAYNGATTASAAQADAELLRVNKEVDSVASTLADEGVIPFIATMAAFSEVNSMINNYVNSAKKSCTGNAERTGFLCMETTSPGMQTAKTVMDVAGPALALINSAQKSCSTTANITRLIGNGLVIAKGLCVGSKVLCDTTCSSAVTQLRAIATAMQTKIPSAINIDAAKCVYQTCAPEVQAKAQASHSLLTKLMAPIAAEIQPVLGTSPGMVVKCESHMKDIVLMGVNILGTLQAQQGARACAEKLKAGDGTTTADYCAQAANAGSSYCKCQKDNTQLGCSGYMAASTTTTKDGKAGDSRINAGGASAFAGPGIGGANMELGAVKSPLNSGAAIGASDPSLAKDATTSGKTGGGSASASGGGAGSAAGGGSELGGADGTEKKKWSFGAFTGGFGGGSSAGSGKGAAGAAGRLGQKDLDAQRKIASEQFRAEVSEASGRSNWEKVRERYVRKSSSLIGK